MRRRWRYPFKFRQDVVELDRVEPEIGAFRILQIHRYEIVGAVLGARDAMARVIEEADRIRSFLREPLGKGPYLAQHVAPGGVFYNLDRETDRLQRPADGSSV